MRHPRRLVLLLVLPVAAVFASSEPGADESERNARLVERYRRDDPAYYERLRRDLRSFHHLPKERQERMRQLDRALHEQDSATQRHLWEVLDRFNNWLDRLPEEDRRRVEDAPGREERLRVIKELREKEFVNRLPKKVQDELNELSPEKKAEKIAALRQEERQLRLALNPEGRQRTDSGPRPDRPVRPSDLTAEQRIYLVEVLLPMLSDKDKSDLKAAEGQWPLFARLLLELAERHPVSLPPGLTIGPRSPKELKGEAKVAWNTLTQKSVTMGGGGAKKTLSAVDGKWPEFAKELTRLSRQHRPQPLPLPPLGPSKPEEFAAAVAAFIKLELPPRLSAEEKDELKRAEGQWPDYPEKLLELARKKNLDIPMMRFPGADDLRAKLRNFAELPEVPDRTLREFFVRELSENERAELNLSLDDPESRERLKKEFFRRNPKSLTRLRDLDRKTLSGKN